MAFGSILCNLAIIEEKQNETRMNGKFVELNPRNCVGYKFISVSSGMIVQQNWTFEISSHLLNFKVC